MTVTPVGMFHMKLQFSFAPFYPQQQTTTSYRAEQQKSTRFKIVVSKQQL